MAPDAMSGLDPGQQPRRLRIHVSAQSDLLSPGDRVQLKASLYPVPAQSIPGGHDMQRELFFAEIGGVGYSLGGAHRLAPSEDAGAPGGWRQWVLQIRTEVTRRITAVLPGSTGGVATAVIAGKRGTMDESVKEAFRNSGLSHLLAIAGLHLGLVGAFVFFAVRGGLALIPYVALRLPIKKIAAGATLIVLFCYLLLSGAAIPTERAFVMNGIVFAAILIDRLRISMRICAIAAAVVLVLEPASLAGVSFQMSFGAVVALIAVYETWGGSLARLLHRGGVGRKVLAYCAGIAVTTVVATIGTEPFSIYHFHKLTLVFAARQRHRGADIGAVDIAVRGHRLPVDAVRAGAAGAGADGLGHRRDDLGRRARRGAARQYLDDAATAGVGAGAGRVRRAVAGAVARQVAALGRAGDGDRPGVDGADPAARHRDQRSRPVCRRPRSQRRLLRRRRQWRAHRPQPVRQRNARRAAAVAGAKHRWQHQCRRNADLRRRCLHLHRAWQAGGDRQRRERACPRDATGSTRSSARCRPGSRAASASRWSTASTPGGAARWRYGSTPAASR